MQDCIQDTLSSRARLAWRPSARASKGILHAYNMQDIFAYVRTLPKGHEAKRAREDRVSCIQ